MVDINLGNKTLVVGVLIALILSYGMVNFDSGTGKDLAFPKAQAVTAIQPPAPQQAESPDTTPSDQPNTVGEQLSAPAPEQPVTAGEHTKLQQALESELGQNIDLGTLSAKDRKRVEGLVPVRSGRQIRELEQILGL